MKRFWILALSTLALILAACSGEPPSNSGTWDQSNWDSANWQ
jgi:hypothetical protein